MNMGRMGTALALMLAVAGCGGTSGPPQVSQPALEQVLKGSDDFTKHKKVFMAASTKLIQDRKCSLADFREMGGWVRSTNAPSKPVYFTYCGGMTVSNRIYLDASTGRTYK